MPTPTLVSTLQAIHDDIERVIVENLAEPDLASRSAVWKDGYAHGIRDASQAFLKVELRRVMKG